MCNFSYAFCLPTVWQSKACCPKLPICEWHLWKFDCNFCRAESRSQSLTVILLHLWSLYYTFFRACMTYIRILKICVSSHASWRSGYTCSRFPLWNYRKLIDHCIKFVTDLWNMFKDFEPCKFWYVPPPPKLNQDQILHYTIIYSPWISLQCAVPFHSGIE